MEKDIYIEMMTEAVIEQLFVLKNKVNIHMPFLKGLGKHSKKVPTLPKKFYPQRWGSYGTSAGK